MKRKLNANDAPEPASNDVPKEEPSFREIGLDYRILQAISKQGFKKPTTVQSNAIPLALNGHHIVARARTGSGKTAAYLLPIIHSILKRKQTSSTSFTSALILVPTRELAEQVHKAAESFCMFCANDVRSINITQKVSEAVIQSLLADSPEIIVATPSKALTALRNPSVSLDKVTSLVIDEADLVLSYGYEEDLEAVAKIIPKGAQICLMSATLSSEVTKLNKLFCSNPVILKLDEEDNKTENLSQFVVKCSEEDKFLLAYVIFKLKLVKGKCIIFVGDIDRCYRVKLFLEQFGIRSCILNSELPVNTRIHVVDEFNKGVYDIIIASDEFEMLGYEDESKEDEENMKTDLTGEREATPEESGKRAKSSSQELSRKRDRPTNRVKDYGVSRGIDFKNVACVINFDLPTSSRSYIHRIGRTARAGQTGMALSFVITADQYRKHPPTSIESTKHDEKVLARIMKHQKKLGQELKPYSFDMNQVAAFRYRLHDALRAVTKIAIREARTKELRQELIKSDKLKQYFEENPGDLYHLRHDSELRPARVQSHLKHVPDYLFPTGGQKALASSIDGQHVGFHKTTENRIRKARMLHKSRTNKIKSRRATDPLKTFKMKARS